MIKFINSADSVLIQISGDIGNSLWSDGWTLQKFQDQLKGLDVSNIVIEINSMGGDLLEGFAIHDAIKNLPARVTARITGSTIIATAADKIEITENSRYLVHNASTFIEGNKEKIGEAFAQLESFDNQILDIYVKRTGKKRDDLANLMKQEKWMTANEALEWGFVDEIIKTKINNKIKNKMSEEEIAALQAENEQLKATVEELQMKLDELSASAEKMEEEQINSEIDAAIEAGKIDAESKGVWFAIGKKDRANMTAAIGALKTSKVSKVSDVPNPGFKVYDDKKELWNAWKNGKITMQEYNDQLTKIK